MSVVCTITGLWCPALGRVWLSKMGRDSRTCTDSTVVSQLNIEVMLTRPGSSVMQNKVTRTGAVYLYIYIYILITTHSAAQLSWHLPLVTRTLSTARYSLPPLGPRALIISRNGRSTFLKVTCALTQVVLSGLSSLMVTFPGFPLLGQASTVRLDLLPTVIIIELLRSSHS